MYVYLSKKCDNKLRGLNLLLLLLLLLLQTDTPTTGTRAVMVTNRVLPSFDFYSPAKGNPRRTNHQPVGAPLGRRKDDFPPNFPLQYSTGHKWSPWPRSIIMLLLPLPLVIHNSVCGRIQWLMVVVVFCSVAPPKSVVSAFFSHSSSFIPLHLLCSTRIAVV